MSFHLMPLYMSTVLNQKISPALRKRMEGKTCFNFKQDPPLEIIAELQQLTEAVVKQWADQLWL